MKNLLLSTAILAATAFTANAQDASSPFRTDADPAWIMASSFIGMRIYASEAAVDVTEVDATQEGWNDIGEVNDIVLNRDGGVDAVLVDIGGFLGMGEHTVAVSMDAIQFVADAGTGDNANDFFLVMNADRATLEGAPVYGMADAAMDDTIAADGTVAVDPNATMAEGDVAADGTVAVDPNATMAEGDVAADGTVAVDPNATMAEGDVAADTEGLATTETEITGVESTSARDPIAREGFDLVARDALTTEDLTGARVYDANDEWIGEVGELVMTEDGKITDAVVDVGGFLGMGEKPVALSIDQIDILRQAGGNEIRVYVPMTKEQLDGMPRFGS